jgi:hypothetical protein
MKILVNSILFLYANLGVLIIILIYLYTYNKKIHIQILISLIVLLIASYFINPSFLVNYNTQKSFIDYFLFLNLLKKAFITFVIIKVLEYIYFTKKFIWHIPIPFIKLLKIFLFTCLSMVIIAFTLGSVYKSKNVDRKIKAEYLINK